MMWAVCVLMVETGLITAGVASLAFVNDLSVLGVILKLSANVIIAAAIYVGRIAP